MQVQYKQDQNHSLRGKLKLLGKCRKNVNGRLKVGLIVGQEMRDRIIKVKPGEKPLQ